MRIAETFWRIFSGYAQSPLRVKRAMEASREKLKESMTNLDKTLCDVRPRKRRRRTNGRAT